MYWLARRKHLHLYRLCAMFRCCWLVNLLALVFSIYGFLYVKNHPSINYHQRLNLVNFQNFFEIAGVACYSIEGIGLLFALRSDYLKHNTFKKFTGAYFSILLFTVALYMVFAISNFLKFYDKSGEIIFYNYSLNDRFIFVLEICYLLVF